MSEYSSTIQRMIARISKNNGLDIDPGSIEKNSHGLRGWTALTSPSHLESEDYYLRVTSYETISDAMLFDGVALKAHTGNWYLFTPKFTSHRLKARKCPTCSNRVNHIRINDNFCNLCK